MKKMLLIITLALASAAVVNADDLDYPGRDFQIPKDSGQEHIADYAQEYAYHFVEFEIDNPAKLSTQRQDLLVLGREDAKEHGLSGQNAEWFASAYADTLELLLLDRPPKVGKAELIGGGIFVSTSIPEVRRYAELLKMGDSDAALAIEKNNPHCTHLEHGATLYIERLNVLPGIVQVHIEGNPTVAYVWEKDLEYGIKQ